MPCYSPEQDPTAREEESVHVCSLLIYVLTALKKEIPRTIAETAVSLYGDINKLDEHTDMLCKICREMDKKTSDKIIYNGHLPAARMLADWWDKHKNFDVKRQNSIWTHVGNVCQAKTPIGLAVIYKEDNGTYSIIGNLINATGIENLECAKNSIEEVLRQRLKDLTEYVEKIVP